MRVVRVGLALVALVVIAWFAIGVRNERDLESAMDTALRTDATPAEIDAALERVDRARLLNPDRGEPLAIEGGLQRNAGRAAESQAAIETLVRQEPDNREAWILLEAFTRRSDPQRSAEARERLREIDPAGTR